MPKVKLTERVVARLPAPTPSGKQVVHWDTELPGFGVLCSPSKASKNYIVQRDLPPDERTCRVTVGAVAELSLEKAKQLAAELLLEMRRGIDPKRKVVIPTLQSTLEAYLLTRKDLRPVSVRMYRQIERTLKPWMNLPLHQITPEMVEARHHEIAAIIGKDGTRYSGTSTANYAMVTLRVLWNFAAERTPDLPPNPVRRLKRGWYPEPRRTRSVKMEELPKFYAAVMALPNPIARDYLLLLLFTGLRKTEAATLRWEDIDLTERMIRLPAIRTKSGRKLDLPMSDVVRDMLVARRALGNAGFVFPGRGASGHLSDTVLPLNTIAKATGITISAHDLRRTFATVAAGSDISVYALKAMMNHALGNDVTAGYVQMSAENLRLPVQRVADRLKALCGIAPISGKNVRKLR